MIVSSQGTGQIFSSTYGLMKVGLMYFVVKRIHLNEPPQCTDFVLFMSPGLKPYKCSQCDYASRSKSNLKAHMNRHSTEKTHLCDLCGKKFKSKCTLKSHKLMHTADGESLSLCLILYAVLLLFLSISTRLA